MSSANQQGGPGPRAKAKKPAMPRSRIVFLIFVAVASVVIVFELRARLACRSSYKAIETAMTEGEGAAHGIYREDIGGLLSGSPKRSYENGSEVLTWKGLLRSHSIRLTYERGGFVDTIERE